MVEDNQNVWHALLDLINMVCLMALYKLLQVLYMVPEDHQG
jgi:hypothetical protein